MIQQKQFVGPIGLGLLVIALCVIAGACTKKSDPPPKLSYNTDLQELRKRFNEDKGKVRLLLILSPT